MKSLFSLCRPVLFLCLATLCLTGLVGCLGSEEAPRDNTAMLAPDDRVSQVPWNKPQGWENNSQLGALANDPRVGGRQ